MFLKKYIHQPLQKKCKSQKKLNFEESKNQCYVTLTHVYVSVCKCTWAMLELVVLLYRGHIKEEDIIWSQEKRAV